VSIDANGADRPSDDRAAGVPVVAALRSNWQEVGAMLPDIGRLLRTLSTDPRVPWRAKLVAGAATGYVLLPRRGLVDIVPGAGIGLDDVVVAIFAVRHLISGAGYDLVRERWTGTDGGFALLIVLAGVDR
jgi:uncharacterized membrane protein YkvA (DUF1232 family)